MTKPIPTHQEAIRSIERLHRILDAGKLLNSTLDLVELTSIILTMVREEVGVDRGTIYVLEPDRKQLRTIVAQGVNDREIILQVGSGIAGTVAATGETIKIRDAYADRRFDSSWDAGLGYRTNDIYCMPIVNRTGDIVGVLELLNRTRPLTEDDEEFLAGVSVHMGLALENARLHREVIEKRRIEHELVLAREIQRNFYPTIPETCGAVQISASNTMCEAVGGDYLGYFPLSDGRFMLALGDVSGKGIGAALVMCSLHATCRALVPHVHSLEHITFVLNETLIETTNPETFVTLLIMLVDPIARRVHYVRAGHNPPLYVSESGDVLLFEEGGGPPLGIFPNIQYRREICNVEPGSVLVLHTDGVSEAENVRHEQFGTDCLIDIVHRKRSGSAAQIHSSIQAAVKEFVGDAPLHDDSTLIVLRF
jgi:serine phosphatase RsbU (regulator of sigma subunit)